MEIDHNDPLLFEPDNLPGSPELFDLILSVIVILAVGVE